MTRSTFPAQLHARPSLHAGAPIGLRPWPVAHGIGWRGARP